MKTKFILLSILLVSCGSSGGSSGGGASTSIDPTGVWSSDCFKDDDLYYKISLTFTGDTELQKTEYFSDEECTSSKYVNTGTYTFTIGSESLDRKSVV